MLRHKNADLEQALALGGEALRMCADHPIRSVWQRATTLHQLTQRWANEPRVIEFADQLRTWRGRAAFFFVAAQPLWLLAIVLICSGLFVTPIFINAFLLVDRDLPAGNRHEANTWVAASTDVANGIIAMVAPLSRPPNGPQPLVSSAAAP